MLPANATIDDVKGLNQENPSRAAVEARVLHMSGKMNDLPMTYRNLLPTTDDPAALNSAERAIRSIHAADASTAGVSMVSGGKTADLTKLSPTQKIEAGLIAEKAGRPKPAEPLSFGRAGSVAGH